MVTAGLLEAPGYCTISCHYPQPVQTHDSQGRAGEDPGSILEQVHTEHGCPMSNTTDDWSQIGPSQINHVLPA